MARRLGVALAVVLVLLMGGGGIAAWQGRNWWQSPGPTAEPRTLVIGHGGAQAIGRQLAEAGLIDHPLWFALGVKLSRTPALRSGEYLVPAAASPARIAALLASGRTVIHRLVVPEGRTTAEAMALVAAAPVLTGQISRAPPEGGILPETYFYSYGDDRQALVDRMSRAMDRQLAQAWTARAPDLPLTAPAQAVVMASMIEKETAVPAERARIAGVFYNRLRLGMPLQSDPTVAYAITLGRRDLDRPLTHADLALASPYNTYAATGLPPAPIDNPGRASLYAALHPEPTDALYFVADGSGGHRFSASLEQHNRNVASWLKRRKSARP